MFIDFHHRQSSFMGYCLKKYILLYILSLNTIDFHTQNDIMGHMPSDCKKKNKTKNKWMHFDILELLTSEQEKRNNRNTQPWKISRHWELNVNIDCGWWCACAALFIRFCSNAWIQSISGIRIYVLGFFVCLLLFFFCHLKFCHFTFVYLGVHPAFPPYQTHTHIHTHFSEHTFAFTFVRILQHFNCFCL